MNLNDYIITGNARYLEPYYQALNYLNSATTKDFLKQESKGKDF